MHLHEIFTVQYLHQELLVNYRLLSLSSPPAEFVQESDLLSESCPLWFQVEGSELKKIRTNSRVYQRYYLLDTGLQALCWEPSKKESDKARISIDSIREVGVVRKSKARKHIESFPTLSHRQSTPVSTCRCGQAATRKPSAPAEFMSRFQRTVPSP